MASQSAGLMDTSMDSSMDSTDSPDSVETPSSQEGSPSRAAEKAPATAASALDVRMSAAHVVDMSSSSEEDSVSDASMAEDSDDEDGRSCPVQPNRPDEPRPPLTLPRTSRPAVPTDPAPGAPSRKRKARLGQHNDIAAFNATQGEAEAPTQLAKKVKLNGDRGATPAAEHHRLPRNRSLLPAEIWHCIFTFCPPRSLGNLMSVNKLFHSYLDPYAQQPIAPERPPATPGVAVALKPNSIWQASRRLFWPCMPTPLQSKTELDMWKLACSRSCQHCGKPGDPVQAVPGDPCSHGPGMDGVAIVWPFATSICGPCLLRKSIKEIDLLLSSSTPSILMPAMPFVLLTDKLNVLPSSLAERGQVPRDVQLTKMFWQSGVERVKQEFLVVKGMGVATTEEWLKGLEGRGAEHQQDSARWEKYASSGGLSRMRNVLYPGFDPRSLQQKLSTSPRLSLRSASPGDADSSASTMPPLPNGMAAAPISSLPPRALPQARHERTKEEVAELKAARRAEIERRARLLDPPMLPSLLVHMPSFQAATQIITPLDDNAWELLKPRLLAQRQDAEKREKEAALQASIQQELAGRNKASEASKDKEPSDSDWDEIQGPLRGRISRHADDVIRNNWDEGDKVTRDNCADFAADVLLYVRRHFYDDVAKEAAAARAAGREPVVDPPKGPFTQKLTLENMKWVFDVKVKPHTESLRKELFLCNGCQGNFKYYGFEGVIQHYAAKHTGALSAGNVVVYWRAEWPEVPPFSPDPRAAKQAYHQARQAAYRQDNSHPQYPYGPYPGGAPTSYPPQPAPAYQPGPLPGSYSTQPYPEPYPVAQPPTYPPAASYPPPQPGYGQAPYQAPPAPYQPYAAPPAATGAYPPGAYGPPVAVAPSPASQAGPPPPPGVYNYNYSTYQSNGAYGYPGSQPSQFPDRYRAQLEELAKLARELWNSSASFKELPGSARLQVIVYHMARRFFARFSEAPPLTMFIDGLSNNKDMRPVRNVNGLMCKACHSGFADPPPTEQDLKSFSMPQLVNHFQSRHVEPTVNMGQYAPVPDWTTDMILLPDLSGLSSLRRSAGGDGQKYQLLSEALPQLFQAGQQGSAYRAPPERQWSANADHLHQHLPMVGDKHERFHATDASGRPDGAVAREPNAQINGGAKLQSGDHLDGARKPSQAAQQDHAQPEQNAKIKKKKQGAKGQNGNGPRKGIEDRGSRPRTNGVNDRAVNNAEEQERRREEEIRAMWAADRAQAARLPSVPAVAPLTQTGSGPAGAARVTGRPGENVIPAPYSRATPLTRPIKEESPAPVPRVQPRSKPVYQPPDYQPPNSSDREGSDPLAALELYLDQERNRTSAETRQQATARVAYADESHGATSRPSHASLDPQDQYRHRYSGARVEEDHRRSCSPVYVRYVDQHPPFEQYRERSPPLLPSEPVYRARQAPPVEAASYERTAAREYYQVYAEDRRPRPVEYEAYELVRARDAQGEYYIRHPVRREPEPEGYYNGLGATVRREVAYVPYEQTPAYPSRQPGQQQPYEIRDSVGARITEPGRMSRADPAYFDEYDPRYPAAGPPVPPPGRQPSRY